ncbi:MAG: carbohydrate ABC transporter permease [Actinobacteria bacterium]|jgi:multiple sugar transport system permease protein|nr:carbohydrate ABC transporter permease [Actinomycetota bacterium]NCW34678.1 carbohydrate ABC transporter permease [Actinomycetota bacterium]NCZ73167.1 carbohydrate ABC transporter permease [Actinomycetota bacterium]NDA41181.1 carbohydrate ABC transporter permease [Actinomycetota bacterium]NDB31059.1 carbohydrate ABC transporter permease [Actinomycetota bacterium]
MFITSLKTPIELLELDQSLIPDGFYIQNYIDILEKRGLIQSTINSLIVAFVSTIITVLVAVPAGYAMARLRKFYAKAATGWILFSQVFPLSLVIIPLFMAIRSINLLDSLQGLILVYVVANLPFALWMLRGYVASIPVELEEASAIDGASIFKILRLIIIPLLTPGIVATSLFTLLNSWNEFFFALVLIQTPERETLPLTLARFVGSEGQVLLGPLAAGAFLATIPSLIVFGIIQKRISSGLLAGAVKG